MNNYLFKIDFNPNDFPQIQNLECFYLDAFYKSIKLHEQKQLNILNSSTIESLKHIEPNTGFLYAKKDNNQNSKNQQKGGLDSVIRKLNLKIYNGGQSAGGKVINYQKIKFLIGVKPDTDIYVRVASIQKEYDCGKQELYQYYLVHFYKYKQDILRANIQPINSSLKENKANQNKMEEELEQPQINNLKQEYEENQQETENKILKRQVEQLQKQVKELQEQQIQQNNFMGILFSKLSVLESQQKEVMKSQNTIILD